MPWGDASIRAEYEHFLHDFGKYRADLNGELDAIESHLFGAEDVVSHLDVEPPFAAREAVSPLQRAERRRNWSR